MRTTIIGICVLVTLTATGCGNDASDEPASTAASAPETTGTEEPVSPTEPPAPEAVEEPDDTALPEVMSDIPCETNDDCWVDDGQPIARPDANRGQDFRPCEDGEGAPVCVQNRCGLTFFDC